MSITMLGTRKVTCSAHDGPMQCRAYMNLTAVAISPEQTGSLILPSSLVILLCPKHFVFKDRARKAAADVLKEGKR